MAFRDATGQCISIATGGASAWERVDTSGYCSDYLRVGDFNGDKKADIC